MFYDPDGHAAEIYERQIWVLGLVEEGTQEARIYIVPDRSRATMEPLIR
jgi:hypothetical protein